jgi:hypothetical protein
MRASSEFYRALNERNMELMAQNWAQTDDAIEKNVVFLDS